MQRHLLLTFLILTMAHINGQGQTAIELNAIANKVQFSHPDSAIALATQAERSATQDSVRARSFVLIGVAQWFIGKPKEAIENHQRAIKLQRRLGKKLSEGYSLNNIGLCHASLKDEKLAMEFYLKSLEVAEELADSNLQAMVNGNIGILYEERGLLEQALEYHAKNLQLLQGKKSRYLANSLHNVALIYWQQEEYLKARNFARQSLKLRTQMNEESYVASAQNLLGLVELKLGNTQLADSLYREALKTYEKLENQWGIAMVWSNLGELQLEEGGNLKLALKHCLKAYNLSLKHHLEWKTSNCQCLAKSYGRLHQTDSAEFFLKRLIELKDSTQKAVLESDIELVSERIDHDKKQALAQAEIQRQEQLRLATFVIGLMSIALFFVLFRSYRRKQRDNELLEVKNTEISEQKHVIEEKNLHITDSIRYAERLQAAILPKDEMFAKHFADFHILYRPKDIVSGDFYWMEEALGSVYLAAADCTGHGVPGAMVSMVGFQGLNKAVLEEKLTSPAAILQRLSDHVEEAFEKSGGSVKDGMDICLVAIDTKKRTVTYAGAHNALWILTTKEELPNANLREEENGYRMFELKADRRSIGGFMDAGSFTETTVELNEGDRLFLFSDGFADQFGGPQGKKLGSKRMRETVREMALSGNLVALGAIFEDWKGKEEQIDDVTVIAVSV